MNKLDGFENILKTKLEHQQYAYDPSQWNSIEKQLPPPKSGSMWKYIAAASVIVTGSILAWALTSNNSDQLAESNLPNNPEKSTLIAVDLDNANTTNDDLNLAIDENLIVVEDRAVDAHGNDVELKDSPNDNKVDAIKDQPKIDDIVVNEPPIDVKVIDDVFPIIKEEPIKIERPSAQFTLTTTAVCEGSDITFSALNKKDNTDYLWDFGNGDYSKKKSPTHKFEEAGVYYVSLETRNSLDNSVVSKSDKIAIVVNPTPNIEFSYEENNSNVIPSIEFINRTDNAISWSWDLGNGLLSDEKDPIITYKRKGFYNITLTATNLEGCSKATQQEIEVANDYNLLAPNSFTPNADGINDFFIPEALKILDVNFEMTIYDKRGLIYQSRSLNNPWNGLNQRDGGKCSLGAYAWIVKYKDHEGIDQIFKGTINLLK
jgi:gliding motility-associated-like protein